VLEYTSKLDLPGLLQHTPGQIHTSSDGQKFNVAVDSVNANYAFKYLGKDLGVSVCSFIDEREFQYFSEVNRPTDREAMSMIDGLLQNEVVKSDIHSTDTHGYTELVFAIIEFLQIKFFPRLKGLKNCAIYAFRKKKEYQELGYKILPDGYVNEEQIEKDWFYGLIFAVSIKLKVATASQLFRRLNSSSPLQDAAELWQDPEVPVHSERY
jgi:TnpA family transposase